MQRIQFDEAFAAILAEKFAVYRKLFEWGAQAHLRMQGLPLTTQVQFNPADTGGFTIPEDARTVAREMVDDMARAVGALPSTQLPPAPTGAREAPNGMDIHRGAVSVAKDTALTSD